MTVIAVAIAAVRRRESILDGDVCYARRSGAAMITRLYVDNYKCLVNFTLELSNPLTLLLGPNGSGKSSVVEVLGFLRRWLAGRATVADLPAYTRTRWQQRPVQTFELDVMRGDARYVYTLVIEQQAVAKGPAKVKHESLKEGARLLFLSEGGDASVFEQKRKGPSLHALTDGLRSALSLVATLDATAVRAGTGEKLRWFISRFARMITVRVGDPRMILPISVQPVPVPNDDLTDFVSWWYHLKLSAGIDALKNLYTDLGEIFEGLNDLRLVPAPGAPSPGGASPQYLSLELKPSEARDWQPLGLGFSELSDGQRILVVLYTLLHFAGSESTLVIDEPDNFLALSEIQPWLLKLFDMTLENERQTILVSHHPEAINSLGNRALLFRRPDGGPTRVPKPFTYDKKLKLPPAEVVARGWESDD